MNSYEARIPRRAHTESRWLSFVTISYVAVIGVWLLLRLVSGDRLW